MKTPVNKRTIAITIALILAFLATLYLGGLFGQLWRGYQNWLSEDGLGGQAVMVPPKLNPFVCILKAFTLDGICSIGFILILAGVIFLYIRFHDKFGSKNYDERNFTRSDSGLYGTAAWMTETEIKSFLSTAPPGKEKGIIFGEKNGQVVYLPEDTRLSKHIAIFGSTGSRKTRGMIRPYLYGSIMRGESVILTDPKMELYDDSSELFRKHGYTVKVFNLTEPEYGDSWNCMAGLKGDTLMAQILTDTIITNTSNGRGDHFWDNGEANLLKSLCLLVDGDSSRGLEAKNLPAVYQLLATTSKQHINAMFDKLPLSHPAKAPYNLFAQASETVQTGIILGLGTRLQMLQSPAVQRITSYSDIDLEEPGKSKCAYFLIIDDQHSSMEFLSSLFFSFLFIKLVDYAGRQPNKRCKVPVNIVLEELSSCGRIIDLGRKLSNIRSRALQVVLVLQGLGQLQNRYPDNEWSEMLGNCDTQIMMGCNDDITADYWSNRSGDSTVEVTGTMTVRKTIAVAQVIPQYRQTEGKGRRRLLTSDEVMRLSENEVLVAFRGQNLLKLDKFDYERHPMSREIEMVSLYDYKHAARPTPIFIPNPQTEKKTKDNAAPARPQPVVRLFSNSEPPTDF